VLLAGARTRADLLWHAEHLQRAERDPAFRYEPVLSQPDAAWGGRRGYVQEHLPDLLAALPRGFLVRVCGGKATVESVLSALTALGVSPERRKFESY
jgi:NAD(P)H-flavin reductase